MKLFGRNKQAKTRPQVEELTPVENDPVSLFLEQKRLEAKDEDKDRQVEIQESSTLMEENFPIEDQIPSGGPNSRQRIVREERPARSERVAVSQEGIKEDARLTDSFDPLLSLIRVAREAMLENEAVSFEESETGLKSTILEMEPVLDESMVDSPASPVTTTIRTLDEPGFVPDEVIPEEDSLVSGDYFDKSLPSVQKNEISPPIEIPEPAVMTQVDPDPGKLETEQIRNGVSDTDKLPESNQAVPVQTEVKVEQAPVQPQAPVNESQPAQPDNPPVENQPSQPATSGILDIFREEVGDKGHGLAVELEEIDIHELLKEAVHVRNMLNRRSGLSENE